MICTEWDPLEEIIVGDCDPAVEKNSSMLQQVFEETKEDLDKLADILKQQGIKVLRPDASQVDGYKAQPIRPRDNLLVYMDNIYTGKMSVPGRETEHLAYYDIFRSMFEQGYNWYEQPSAKLNRLDQNETWYGKGETIYADIYKDKILTHMASMTKVGNSLLYNSRGPGSKLGYDWMKRNIPIGTKLLPVDGFGHIDMLWFMVDDDTVVAYQKDFVPQQLQNKKIIELYEHMKLIDFKQWSKDISDTGGIYTDGMLSKWFGGWRSHSIDECFDTNVLVLAPRKVLLTNPHSGVQRVLEQNNIEVLSTTTRHGLLWESGAHCFTLDTKREGKIRSVV